MRRFNAIVSALEADPWMIEPHYGERLAAMLSRRLSGERATAAELAEAADIRAARDAKRQRPRPAAVAVIPVYGPMVRRPDVFEEVSGVIGTDQLGQLVDQAADDPSVDAIILDVDSPGGSVFGTAELAQKVADAAKRKKVIAVANSLMASAAYYVGSQASELVASPSAMLGSIGVYQMHVDQSQALATAGVKVTFVSSSPEKVAGNSYEPLGELGAAKLSETVNGYYRDFVAAVATGRGVSQAKVKEDFGKGGVVLAKDAVARGMADTVATLDEVLGRYGLRTADLSPAGSRPDLDVELMKCRLRLSRDSCRSQQ